MIDLHCHILTAVDDGAQTVDASIEMAKEAYSEGIRNILLTPHHMDGEYVNHKEEVIKKTYNLQKIFMDNGLDIKLRAGQEVHLNGDLLKSIENNDILFADGDNGKYLMLELPHNEVPRYTFDMIFEIQLKGIVPIIVHPERNKGIQNDPSLLYRLVKQGCLTQITATSYVGGFGKNIQKFTDEIVDAGLGFIFSSDAHNLEGRRFRMSQAYSRLKKKKGSLVVEKYKKNAIDVWNSNSVSITEFRKISKHSTFKSFFNIFKTSR